jgi:hypothetical protein
MGTYLISLTFRVKGRLYENALKKLTSRMKSSGAVECTGAIYSGKENEPIKRRGFKQEKEDGDEQ